MSERLATIASEAFGPFPIQSDEENLTAIETGIFEQRQELERLEIALAEAQAQRDAERERCIKCVEAEVQQ